MQKKPTHGHKQVCVKVNAYVDENIAPVVEAMSKLPDMVTEYSCEDNRSELEISSGMYVPRAYITFDSRGERCRDWRVLGKTCDMLAKAIAECRHAQIFVRWNEGIPIGVFEFNTEDAYWLAKAIRDLLKD